MSLEKELAVAQRIAGEAGKLALENRAKGFESEIKPDDSPVTSADRASERLMTKLLTEAFPEDGLLGEEGAARETKNGRRWIMDPIDGTKSFIRNIPTWGSMLALELDGKVAVGACNLPGVGELYSAAEGLGAFCDGERIHCSTVDRLERSLICMSGFDKIVRYPWGENFIEWIGRFWSVRNLGGCMDGLSVAAGRAEVWISMEAKAWDLAPLRIIGEEAGARFFNLYGGSSIYGGNGVMAAPGVERAVRDFLRANP